MEKVHRMSDNEKKLLHVLGRNPEISIKELLTHTTYRWERTVKRKLKQLKEQHILYGPFYDINYSSLCRNPFHKLFCILETNQSYEIVIPYLKLIDSLKWIYPVLSSHKKVLNVAFFSSNDAALVKILEMLKDNDIITDYIVRVWCTKRMVETPNLFGDPNPSLDNLLDPCDLPDMSFGHHNTDWNECDISILPYLERGEKLIEILRKENNQHSKRWTYEQIKYSREKMVKNGLIEKMYGFSPFPLDQCVRFHLFLRTEDTALTQRILYNFARGARLYKLYVLCEEWGWISCSSHRQFLTNLMYKLDQIHQITEREIYHIRSFPNKKYYLNQPMELRYFDFETQTLKYPYHIYEEKIKERIESEQLILSR